PIRNELVSRRQGSAPRRRRGRPGDPRRAWPLRIIAACSFFGRGGSAGARALLAALVLLALPAVAGAAPRPNVVVVLTDDQAVQTLRPDTMPTVTERVAGQGTSFTDAIATTPLCCPSRASMLTGQYAHNN